MGLWRFLAQINWNNAGGASFVQLWTGLNLAFFAWDKYREALSWPREKCEEIVKAATCNILDAPHRIKIADEFVKWSSVPITIHKCLWWVCCIGAVFAALYGNWMLYIDRYSPRDWITMLPTLVYVTVSFINLFAFWLVTRVVGWCCDIVPIGTGAAVTKQIEQLDQDTQ